VITFQDLLDIFEDYNPQAKFVIYNKKTRAVLGSAVGYDAAKAKASQVRKQYNLKFDDVSFMSNRKFYGSRNVNKTASPGRIEYAPRYNPSKGRRFRGRYDAHGNFHDID